MGETKYVYAAHQNSDAGEVEVILLVYDISVLINQDRRRKTNTKVIEPVNLLESVPPKVSSPLLDASEVVGWKDTATRFCDMLP